MTRETRDEAVQRSSRTTATPAHAARVRAARRSSRCRSAPTRCDARSVAHSTGRSGHVAGGVWCVLDDGARDASSIAATSRRRARCSRWIRCPRATRSSIDASYGDDDVAVGRRVRRRSPRGSTRTRSGCVLPTPLYGRSAELLAIARRAAGARAGHARGAVARRSTRTRGSSTASASGWRRASHAAQIGATASRCRARRCSATTAWACSGPSREHPRTMPRASRIRRCSPATCRRAAPANACSPTATRDWIRLPTHPTLRENVALAPRARRDASCSAIRAIAAMLARLARAHCRDCAPTLATGDLARSLIGDLHAHPGLQRRRHRRAAALRLLARRRARA